ncbi:MAG: inositol monophosphatase family protein [Armatimonadota bacterium]
MNPRLEFALEAVRKAGDSTLVHFRNRVGWELKGDSSPVTIADQEAEQILRDALGLLFPGEAILGEEQGLTGSGTTRWIIDPIDGTKSFVSGVPLYATLLAYEVDGVPELGVCYFPALGEIIYAARGEGAFFNDSPCRVSTRTSISGSILACGGPLSMIKHGKWDGFAMLSESSLTSRTWSDAYGHALVATGRVDAMIDPVVSRWDLSAIRVIVEEAGGTFSDFNGGDPFDRGDFGLEAISSNGLVHQAVLEAFAS